jgi:glycosyltransferase involved in cell wall biosynthesis
VTAASAPATVPILQLVTNFKLGGTERHVSNLVRLLDRSRFDVHLACLRRLGEFLERVERECGAVSEYPIHRLYGPATLRRQGQLARDLRRKRIQVVHTYGFYANVFGLPAARLAQVPLIVASIRDTGDHLSGVRRLLQRLMCHFADCVLVNAEAVRERLLAEGFPAHKLVVIPNGINLVGFSSRLSRDTAREALGLPAGGPLVTVISRLNPMKGIEHFLQAAQQIAARLPEVRFLVVGDCEAAPGRASYRSFLEGRAARLGLAGRVLFLGFRSDVADLLAASTVSVLPSLSEGLSNVLLESMAVGVPVVATRVGGNPEAVEHGVTGLLVDPGDPSGLAHAITLLLEHPHLASCYGEAARQRVLDRFSDQRMVRATEDFYLAWLARKGRRDATHELRERTA